MRFSYKYTLLLHKSYFDAGFGLLNYLKYFIGFYALSSLDVKSTMILTLVFGIICYVIGYYWYKNKWIIAQQEVFNNYNLFVREMRSKLGKKQRKETQKKGKTR